MLKITPVVLFLAILLIQNPLKAQQKVSLFIETPCQATELPDEIYLPDNNPFTINPNPNQGDFILEFDDVLIKERAEISIYNIQGSIIWQNSVDDPGSQYPVHLKNAKSGLYLVTVRQGESLSREKLIVF